MRVVVAVALAAFLAGCLCGGGGDAGLNASDAVTSTAGVRATTTLAYVVTTSTSATVSTTEPVGWAVDCPKFKDKMDRDICVMALAARRRDPSLCKGIVHPTVERICSSVLLKGECTGITDSGYRTLCEAALANDPSRCGRLPHGDVSLCYTAVAIFNMDLATCDKAPDRGEKTLCYSLVGSCAQLKDPQDIRLCREKVSDMIH